MRRYIFTIVILIYAISAYSQTDTDKKDKYKFVASFDMRNSIIIGHSVKFNGVKLGLGNSRHKFGLGLYGLRKPVLTMDNKIDSLDATDTNRYHYGFISFYYERILFHSKRWEITAPFYLNFGSLKGEYLSDKRIYKPFLDRGVTSVIISVKSHFKIVRWVGLQAGVGYNFILSGDKRTRKALNAPFYSFGVKIFLGEVWKITTNKEYRKSDWKE
jgi:hypothetical protein|tara:strand:+ start:1258 stop:1902 length:645 start_codon:yes stop_codon:yes gene_type:complete